MLTNSSNNNIENASVEKCRESLFNTMLILMYNYSRVFKNTLLTVFIDHRSIFLIRTINHCVIFIRCIFSLFVPIGTSLEFFPRVMPATEIS